MVDNSPPSSMHVSDLDGSTANMGPSWTGTSGGTSCTTDGNGQCSITSSEIPKRTGSVTFTVTDVSHGTLAYDSNANHGPDGDSNGTEITVTK